VKNYHICVICQDRTDHLKKLIHSLIHNTLANEFHINFYVDSLDSYKPIHDESIVSFLENYEFKYLFKTFNIHYQQHKLGTWNNKIFSLYDSISRGSDLTLLLEDDLIIERDAINFVVQTYAYLSERQITKYSISLFSYNFLNIRLPYSNAKNYFEINYKEITSAACIDNYPCPWGIGFPKEMILHLKNIQWNGNDQKLVKLFKNNSFINFYPAITRSYHMGNIKISNKKILPHQHLKLYDDLNVELFDYYNILEDGKKKSDYYYSKLMNDFGIRINTISIICDEEFNMSLLDNLHAKTGIHIHVYCIKNGININEFFNEILSKSFSNHFLISIKNLFFLEETLLLAKKNNINYIVIGDDFDNSAMQLIT
jgi:hypothetical protein